MKKLITILIALCMIASCTAQDNTKRFTINGTWPNSVDGDTIYYIVMSQMGVVPLDTAYVKNGKFKFQVKEKEASLRNIIGVHQGPVAAADIIVTPEGSVDVEIASPLGTPAKISNNADNELWQTILQKETEISNIFRPLLANMNDTTKGITERFEARKKLEKLTLDMYNFYYNCIIDNMPSPVCGIILQSHASEFSSDQLNTIIDQMAIKMPDNAVYKQLEAQRAADNETAPGKPYKELALVDTDGNMKRLSDVVAANKLVLVDFWASWCAPCRAEMPNVVNIYKKYHSKGLEIYGVSLDENMVSWQNAINVMKMEWIQVSDLKGWSSSAVKTYNIKGIPATILIDNNGKIVAKNLRGNDLAQKIAEILNK